MILLNHKILLIQSPIWTVVVPPMGIALLAASLKEAGYLVACQDLNLQFLKFLKTQALEYLYDEVLSESKVSLCAKNPLYEKFREFVQGYVENIDSQVSVIGFSVQRSSYLYSCELAAQIKAKYPNIKIIFGGPTCFSQRQGPAILKENASVDLLSTGYAENTISNAVSFLLTGDESFIVNLPGYAYRDKNHEIIVTSEQKSFLGNYPIADYSFFNVSEYTNRLPIEFSRGCINRCVFCNEHENLFSVRDPKLVVDEILHQRKLYPHFGYINFTDSILNGDISKLKDLCEEFISRKNILPWAACLAIREELDMELLLLMRQAGCHLIYYGVESGSNKILRLMGKMHSKELAAKVIVATYKAGIKIIIPFLVGFPGENIFDYVESTWYMYRLKKYCLDIKVSPIIINKGSTLYEYAQQRYLVEIHTDRWHWRTIDNKNTHSLRRLRTLLARVIVKKSPPFFLRLVKFFKIILFAIYRRIRNNSADREQNAYILRYGSWLT